MPPGGTKGNRGGTGRPPKPTKLHVLQGTYRPDRHAKRLASEPQPTGDGRLPPPPPDLREEQRRVWLELEKVLRFRIFTDEDVRAFKTMVSMIAQWEEVDAHIAKHGVSVVSETKDGRVVETMSSQARMWSDLNGKLLQYFARFGMTPSDRARVREVQKGGGANVQAADPDDEFATA